MDESKNTRKTEKQFLILTNNCESYVKMSIQLKDLRLDVLNIKTSYIYSFYISFFKTLKTFLKILK